MSVATLIEMKQVYFEHVNGLYRKWTKIIHSLRQDGSLWLYAYQDL